MHSSRKYPYFPHRKDWNFLAGGGFWKTKTFKEMYEAQLEFPEEWGGVRKKSLPWGRSGYFLELHNVMMKFNVFSTTEQMHEKLTSICF